MMTVAMIISLELHVGREDEPEYYRAMAFVALLAVYGSMRMDDLQGLLPNTMKITAQGFRATLGRTKTTGADRRNKEVSVFIHRQAGLSGFDWLGEGFKIWQKYKQPRDFLVLVAQGGLGRSHQALRKGRGRCRVCACGLQEAWHPEVGGRDLSLEYAEIAFG